MPQASRFGGPRALREKKKEAERREEKREKRGEKREEERKKRRGKRKVMKKKKKEREKKRKKEKKKNENRCLALLVQIFKSDSGTHFHIKSYIFKISKKWALRQKSQILTRGMRFEDKTYNVKSKKISKIDISREMFVVVDMQHYMMLCLAIYQSISLLL